MKRHFITVAVFLAAMQAAPANVAISEAEQTSAIENTVSARETLMESIIILASEHSGISEDKIHPDSTFDKDLGMDSLTFIEFISDCEELYGVKIPNADFGKLLTVKDLHDYIKPLLYKPL